MSDTSHGSPPEDHGNGSKDAAPTLSKTGMGCLALIAGGIAIAAVNCQNDREKADYDAHPPMPQNPATESVRTAAPASYTKGTTCSPAQEATLAEAKTLRDTLQMNPTVQAALGSQAGFMSDAKRDLCLTTAAYGSGRTEPVDAWLSGRRENTYAEGFFKGVDRNADCRRAVELLTLSACEANVGGADCANGNGDIQVQKNPSKLPSSIQHVWKVADDTCKGL